MRKKNLLFDNRAQAGIGTLIIFIAMVLVAAVAAAVLLQTSGVLSQKATQTGTEAITEVSSNLMIERVSGTRADSTTERLSTYNITVRCAAGAGNIDLNQMIITAIDKNTSVDLSRGSTADATNYSLEEVRDEDDSFNATDDVYVINSGDLIKITINATAAEVAAAPRDDISFTLIPESGNPAVVDLTTPSSYGIKTIIQLYPIET
jgi:flagellin FlaB